MNLFATAMDQLHCLSLLALCSIIMSLGFPILAITLKSLSKLTPLSRKPAASSDKIANLQNPTISIEVIIPAHNEAANLAATLLSINAATNFAKAEELHLNILVAADGCTDGTAQVAKQYGARVISKEKNKENGVPLKTCSYILLLLQIGLH